MPEWLTKIMAQFTEWLLAFLPNLGKGIVIAVLGVVLARVLQRVVQRAAERLKYDMVLWDYVARALRYLTLVVFVISALKMAGFPVNSLLATFGISGIIIGLGARQSIANYFAGIMLLAARPFRRGDLIEFGPPPQIGLVRAVKMTYTALDTLDNVRIIVPNSVIWRGKVSNFSVHSARAIRVPLSIPYEVDVDWVKDIALDVLRRHDAVLNDPAAQFTVSDCTPTEVRGLLIAWSSVETMTVFGDVIAQMRKEFEQAGLAVTVPAKEIDLKREE